MSDAYFVHETAQVDPPVDIGERTSIWHFCHIMPGARIGVGCNIGQNVYVDRDVQIGNGCKIQNNVSVYKGVTLEDDVFCGPSMVFTNVINPRAFIERKSEFRQTRVRRGATLGANCTIVCGWNVGEYAMIGAGTSNRLGLSLRRPPARRARRCILSIVRCTLSHRRRARNSHIGQPPLVGGKRKWERGRRILLALAFFDL